MEKKTRKNLPLSKVLHDNIDDYRNVIDDNDDAMMKSWSAQHDGNYDIWKMTNLGWSPYTINHINYLPQP